ncbi:hypothetical protein Syun_031955 [Stephania yunnanensis]|uniref:Uncharacterized protein n=1 Tax=Stephania yunnanensis TaxID=152371 RepID=A0AAP0DZF9_9MAGN
MIIRALDTGWIGALVTLIFNGKLSSQSSPTEENTKSEYVGESVGYSLVGESSVGKSSVVELSVGKEYVSESAVGFYSRSLPSSPTAAHNQCALKALLMPFSSESSAAYEPTFPDPSDPESPSAAESASPSSVPASSPTAALEPLPRSEMGASVQSHRSHLSVRCFESLLSSLYFGLLTEISDKESTRFVRRLSLSVRSCNLKLRKAAAATPCPSRKRLANQAKQEEEGQRAGKEARDRAGKESESGSLVSSDETSPSTDERAHSLVGDSPVSANADSAYSFEAPPRRVLPPAGPCSRDRTWQPELEAGRMPTATPWPRELEDEELQVDLREHQDLGKRLSR